MLPATSAWLYTGSQVAQGPFAFGVLCSFSLSARASPAEQHGKGGILPLVAGTALDPRSLGQAQAQAQTLA